MSNRTSPESAYSTSTEIEESVFSAPPAATSHTTVQRPRVVLRYRRLWNGVRTVGFPRVPKPLPWNVYHQYLFLRTPGYVQGTSHGSYPPSTPTNGSPFANGASGSYRKTVDFAYSSDMPTSISHLGEAEAKAVVKLLDQLSGLKVNLAQFFAERHQTINMVANTANRLVHAAVALKHLRFKDMYAALGIGENFRVNAKIINFTKTRAYNRLPAAKRGDVLLANYWLELQYGWKPLLTDVFDTVSLLANRFNDDQFVQTLVSKASHDISEPRYGAMYVGQPGTAVFPGVFTFKQRTGVKLRQTVKPTPQTRDVLKETGMTNPALLAWELIPYSFVVDWFLPVGNYIEYLGSKADFQLDFVRRVRLSRASFEASGQGNASWREYGGVVNLNVTASGSAWWAVYDRDTIPPYPSYPLLLKNPVSTVHVANALALLRGAFRPR